MASYDFNQTLELLPQIPDSDIKKLKSAIKKYKKELAVSIEESQNARKACAEERERLLTEKLSKITADRISCLSELNKKYDNLNF